MHAIDGRHACRASRTHSHASEEIGAAMSGDRFVPPMRRDARTNWFRAIASLALLATLPTCSAEPEPPPEAATKERQVGSTAAALRVDSDLVISQIYAAGSSGSPPVPNRVFIELFNRGTVPLSLADRT